MVKSCALCSLSSLGEGVVAVAGIAANGMLKQRHRLRRPIVRLAAHPVGVFAADFERSAQDRRIAKRVRMPALTVSAAISAKPAPSIEVAVPKKNSSIKARERPTASNICAPQ